MQKVLFEKGSFQLKLTTEQVPTDLQRLIDNTVLGTKGLIYRHGRVGDRLKFMHHPYHLSLYRGEKMLGNLSLAHYDTKMSFGMANAYYIRYFAFDKIFKTSSQEKKKRSSDNVFRRIIANIMTRHPSEHGINYNETTEAPAYHYAYIEPDNMRSLHHAMGFDFETSRKFETIPFSRLKPKKAVDFEEVLDKKSRSEVKELLSEFYSGHNGVHFEYLFHHDNYFVVRDNDGKIIAGCQVNDCMFHVENVGSPMFQAITRGLKITGLDKAVLDIENLRFLSFDHVYTTPGNEKVLIKLMESLLAKFKLKFSLLWFDSEDPTLKMLVNSGKLGWVSKVYNASPNNIVTHSITLNEEQKKALTERPWFIATFDMT
jgi:hypothetical protein